MGFTTVVEPALVAQGAVQAHLELADIPYIDRGALAVLGNTDFLLKMLRAATRSARLASTITSRGASRTTKALGVKVINAGGGAAFKENVRTFGLDDVVPSYGVSSRAIIQALAARRCTGSAFRTRCIVHCNNLGVAGTSDVTADRDHGGGGRPADASRAPAILRLWRREGKRNFSSAAQLGGGDHFPQERHRRHRSGDVRADRHHFRRRACANIAGRSGAKPKKSIIWDGDGNGGGIVPYAYNAKNYYNALQWAIGLELFLLIDDPWRVFFTTDHPNGAPFTTYPQVLHLLMDANERADWISTACRKAR